MHLHAFACVRNLEAMRGHAGNCPDQKCRGAAELLARGRGPDGAGHQGHCRVVSADCLGALHTLMFGMFV